MERYEHSPKAAKRLERTYCLAQALFWLAASLPAALSVLLMQSRGIDLLQVGMLMGVYSLTVVLVEFPSGVLADLVGRKRTALLGYAFMLAAYLAFLPAFSFLGFLLGWVLMGVGRAFASGALQAWFIDGLLAADPGTEIQPPLARAGTFELLGLTLGTLGGSYLPQLAPFLPADGQAVLTPLAVPLLGSALLMTTLIVFVGAAVREPRSRPNSAAGAAPRLAQVVSDAFRFARRDRTLLLLFAATLAGGFALAGVETFWQPHFAGLLGGAAGNTAVFGVVMAGCFFAGMLGNLASIRVSRWLGGRYALVAGLFQALSGLVLVLLAWQVALAPAVGLFWLLYMGRSVGTSPHATLFNRRVPGERRSTLLSLESLVAYGGFFLGSVALGYVAEHASTAAAWSVAGAVAAVSAVAYSLISRAEGAGLEGEPGLRT